MEHAGYSCLACATAEEAVSLVATEEFDLIIADIHMPGNTNLELVQELGKRTDMPPIILITGKPSIETATRAVRLRVIDYLLKPVDPARLIELTLEGVTTNRILRLLRSQRERLKDSVAEINRCEELARSAPATTANAALSTYIKLAAQQAVTTIIDIGSIAELIVSHDEKGEAGQRLNSSRPLLLVDAIRETIQVLEQTKNSFKSRELADLRKRLQTLVTTPQRV